MIPFKTALTQWGTTADPLQAFSTTCLVKKSFHFSKKKNPEATGLDMYTEITGARMNIRRKIRETTEAQYDVISDWDRRVTGSVMARCCWFVFCTAAKETRESQNEGSPQNSHTHCLLSHKIDLNDAFQICFKDKNILNIHGKCLELNTVKITIMYDPS